jgi:DNA polymerase II small subunit/DNA polymerase delta subunit B
MTRKKKILIIVSLVLLVAASAGWYVYREYNRVHEDTATVKADFSVQAADLIKEFEKNEQLSNQKYWNKVIEVRGIVKDVKADDRGYFLVALGDTASMSSVRCSMDSVHNREAAAVQKGKLVVMKGVCTGFNADELLGSDVILVRSVVKSKDKSIAN